MVFVGIVTTAVNFYSMKHVGFATTDSQVGNLSASVQTYVACTWSDSSLDVDFGSLLNPGTDDINATDNYILSPGTGYNVTVDPLTTSDVNITISGEDLIDGSNFIGIGNITYAYGVTNNDAGMVPSNSTSITGSSAVMAPSVASGSDIHYRFWLDIPSSTVAGSYVGNYTIQCEEA